MEIDVLWITAGLGCDGNRVLSGPIFVFCAFCAFLWLVPFCGSMAVHVESTNAERLRLDRSALSESTFTEGSRTHTN